MYGHHTVCDVTRHASLYEQLQTIGDAASFNIEPRAAVTRAVRAARAAGCHLARGRARRRGAAGRATAGGERNGRRRGRAPRRRAPGARRDAAATPARGARTGAPARARAAAPPVR